MKLTISHFPLFLKISIKILGKTSPSDRRGSLLNLLLASVLGYARHDPQRVREGPGRECFSLRNKMTHNLIGSLTGKWRVELHILLCTNIKNKYH